MAPNFQSSFIPKDPVAAPEVFQKKKAGLVGVLVVSLFIASITIAVLLYFYKGIVKGDIESMQNQLIDAEKSIDKKTISEMSNFSKKLDTIKSIVSKHQVIASLMNNLASSTVSTVYFSDFDYSNNDRGVATVSMKGKALGYGAVAQQEEVLVKNKYFKSVVFSNLNLDDKGFVSFDLVISVDPQITTYVP